MRCVRNQCGIPGDYYYHHLRATYIRQRGAIQTHARKLKDHTDDGPRHLAAASERQLVAYRLLMTLTFCPTPLLLPHGQLDTLYYSQLILPLVREHLLSECGCP